MTRKRFSVSLVACALLSWGAGAQAGQTYVYDVSGDDGYGLEDCLSGGKECGFVVADAWCEAHGHAHATQYGPRSLVEGGPTRVSTASEPYVVTCGD